MASCSGTARSLRRPLGRTRRGCDLPGFRLPEGLSALAGGGGVRVHRGRKNQAHYRSKASEKSGEAFCLWEGERHAPSRTRFEETQQEDPGLSRSWTGRAAYAGSGRLGAARATAELNEPSEPSAAAAAAHQECARLVTLVPACEL